MEESDKIQLYENQPIRTTWDEENEEWYFSIVDVIAVLTDSPNPQTYWRVMKKRLKDEANETVTNCNALRMKAADGKKRMTDVANTQQLLRIIQSIPSKKAEPFKMWLAQVGRERIEEIKDLKGLKKENLRDNMSTLELALNMLAEATTTELTKTQNPQGLEENRIVAQTGGQIAGEARTRIEKETGTSVITSSNANSLNSVVIGMIENVKDIPE